MGKKNDNNHLHFFFFSNPTHLPVINMSLDEHSSSIMTDEEEAPPLAPPGVGASGYGSGPAPLLHPGPASPLRGPGGGVRHRPLYSYQSLPMSGPSGGVHLHHSSHAGLSQEAEPGYVMIPKPENPVEAQRLVNNYTVSLK